MSEEKTAITTAGKGGWLKAIVGTVANHTSHKDYPTLLRAAREVVDSGRPVRFVAVGAGPLEAEVRALHAAGRLGLRVERRWRRLR